MSVKSAEVIGVTREALDRIKQDSELVACLRDRQIHVCGSERSLCMLRRATEKAGKPALLIKLCGQQS